MPLRTGRKVMHEKRALVVGRENLEKYLEELKARHCKVSTKVDQRKQQKRVQEEVEEDVDEDEAKLSRLTSRLKEIDLSYTSVPPPGPQIIMPEIVFQPLMVSVDQAGVGEMASIAMRRVAD
ncbi:hypothetical protein SELMODRAFT_430657 [Selaginella moellendorffii]|uniref:Uncharacterized protein n=1 Tax=Selaginella moellendorffii TaxID=88036 RepID=D8TA32_SELML|nr:hypothetical protein SELMODRAFT_430657 [Selaginella moellendorffii]